MLPGATLLRSRQMLTLEHTDRMVCQNHVWMSFVFAQGLRIRRRLGIADLDLLEALFAPLVDSPFFVKDAQFRYVATNDAMVRLCGLSRQSQLLGRTARDIFSAPVASMYEIQEKRVLMGDMIPDRIEMVSVPNRRPTWLLTNQIPLFDDAGSVVGTAGSCRRLSLGREANTEFFRMAQVVEDIRRNFDRPLNLQRLANAANLSVSKIERNFQKLMRETPRKYHQKIRMQHAVSMLCKDYQLEQIAIACGYSDHSSFSRGFKAVLGVTPTEYRQLNRDCGPFRQSADYPARKAS
jgi:AraC-like DNA-binding protein